MTDFGWTSSKAMAAGSCGRFRSCGACTARQRSSCLPLANAGTTAARSRIGSAKPMPGQTTRVSAFDFPLRYRLRDLCQTYGFSLRQLTTSGTVLTDQAALAVTFVENHDVVRGDPIVDDKMLAMPSS